MLRAADLHTRAEERLHCLLFPPFIFFFSPAHSSRCQLASPTATTTTTTHGAKKKSRSAASEQQEISPGPARQPRATTRLGQGRPGGRAWSPSRVRAPGLPGTAKYSWPRAGRRTVWLSLSLFLSLFLSVCLFVFRPFSRSFFACDAIFGRPILRRP